MLPLVAVIAAGNLGIIKPRYDAFAEGTRLRSLQHNELMALSASSHLIHLSYSPHSSLNTSTVPATAWLTAQRKWLRPYSSTHMAISLHRQ